MRNLFSRVRFWTFFMSYGPGLPTPLFNWRPINGSDSARLSWQRLSTWWKTSRLNETAQGVKQFFSPPFRREKYEGRHRDGGRATRASNRSLRQRGSMAPVTLGTFGGLATDPDLVGVAYSPGSRVYRRLSWSNLNHEAAKVRSRYFPGDDFDQVP